VTIPALAMPPTAALSGRDETVADRERRVLGALDAMRAPGGSLLTLDDLAETAYYSRFHFVRSFRAVTGITPGAFQAALRFSRARELLLSTEASVTEICGEVGYSSLGTFSDRFRDLVGVSPQAFRELPHLIAAIPAGALRDGVPPSGGPGDGRCRIVLPPTVAGMRGIYVGLYPDHRAAGIPITGAGAGGPGMMTLTGFPPGRYVVLSVAFRDPIDGLGHLLPAGEVLAASSGRPVAMGMGANPVVQLDYRPLRLTDAPVLTALPALVVERLTSGLSLQRRNR
jgi:AraC family transcriptional regulator